MEDERNTPQEEKDEVEAHRRVPAPSRHFPAPDETHVPRSDDEDDEVEAHRRGWAPVERKIPKPSE
jgi:hypothetical protein